MSESMGHKFDADLMCKCGVSWGENRDRARLCTRVISKYKMQPKEGHSLLDGMRRLAGYSLPVVASAAGVSRQTAQRALSGEIGGRGRVSRQTAEHVSRVTTDIIDSG